MTKKNTTKELKRQNTILHNQIEELKARESFLDTINIESLDTFESLQVPINPRLREQVIPISILSDFHVEEKVEKTVVNGLNEYNLTIAQYRMEKYFKRLLYMLRQCRKAGYKFDTLVLGLLGDFISGFIHEELREENYLTPVQASLFAQEQLIKGIKTLSELGELKKIIIPCIPGNHGRTTLKKHLSNGFKNSYEWLMYNNIKDIFKATPGYENVEFLIAESEFLYLDLFGYLNMFSHGDHFKYQGGIGGIYIPLQKWLLRENQVASANPSLAYSGIDMAWAGHWHTIISISKFRGNGSGIGYNGFARSYGFAPEPPKMQFQLLDAKRGYTLNNAIDLTDF